ncbi:DUF3300 domain-containing protein [Aestuariibacter salexigens]|uniref:DUF3300 domain-containing protein n=1 Tax=Aestuariibacter salexigens TaxID=226010 RepID=UPI000400ED2F|nr:DUF3300 domain-containing protein [Aestuariibacter salexigens]
MRSYVKLVAALVISVGVMMALAINLAQAQEGAPEQSVIELDQAQLDQMLAPIALYPDTLLSHILIAATYPLEVVEADRWRQRNATMNEDQVRDAVEEFDWDPSVKALAPFSDLLRKMSSDLDWLQGLGDAFLANEQQVLASIQYLRTRANDNGYLKDNEYVNVEHDDNQIIIETVRKEVVYVPYYDTRVVYGPWWHISAPLYWHHPSHFVLHAGFYWSPRIRISPRFYFGGFHWHRRYIVMNHHYPRTWHSHNSHQRHYKRVYSREYTRWQHDASHRRGVRYRYTSQPRVTSKIVARYDHDGERSVVRHRVPEKHTTAVHRAKHVQDNLRQVRPQNRGKNMNPDRPRHSGKAYRDVMSPNQDYREQHRRAGKSLPVPSQPVRKAAPERQWSPSQPVSRPSASASRGNSNAAPKLYRNNNSFKESRPQMKSQRPTQRDTKQKQH